jgi:hypothetical protein
MGKCQEISGVADWPVNKLLTIHGVVQTLAEGSVDFCPFATRKPGDENDVGPIFRHCGDWECVSERN